MKIKNMAKKFFISFILLAINTWQILAQSITSTPVGPGVIHYHEFRAAGPWQIHVLAIDLTNQWIELKTVKANDQLVGRERTSSMVARYDREGHRVVGAINADFYETGGVPVGAQVLNARLLKRPTNRSIFGLTSSKKPLIDIVSFEGIVSTGQKKIATINGVNEIRGLNKLILYNRSYGPTTRTNIWGTEIIAEQIESQVSVNDSFLVVVIAKDSVTENGHGNNAIPTNGVILSGHGTARTLLNETIFVGDSLSIVLKLLPIKKSICELIGGTPRLIRNGIASVEWEQERTSRSFAIDRHPRTAVGFSRDSSKVYLFIVDGRQPGYSVGMSLFELANYMLEWNVDQGINLDGGGSTTMVIRGSVVNKPSDTTGERAVANALLVVSTAPNGTLSFLKISPKNIHLLAGSQLKFSVEGLDQYYSLARIDTTLLKWSCDQNIGTITENGLFTAGMRQDSGYIYVDHSGIRDSARVHITKAASIELLPARIRASWREFNRTYDYNFALQLRVKILFPTLKITREFVTSSSIFADNFNAREFKINYISSEIYKT